MKKFILAMLMLFVFNIGATDIYKGFHTNIEAILVLNKTKVKYNLYLINTETLPEDYDANFIVKNYFPMPFEFVDMYFPQFNIDQVDYGF